MSNQEIFIKAIEIALKNGWKILGDENCLELCIWNITEDLDFVIREREYPDEGQATYSVNDIIFSHDFARAFFGENGTELYGTKGRGKKLYDTKELLAWEFYLRDMVVEDDPVKYLERFFFLDA